MIAGQIQIQMMADLVRLQKGMDEAQGLVERASMRISSAADLARGALAGIASGLTVGVFASMIKGAIEAAEALNDLSIKTGMSVERLSALESIGRTTGTGADTIAAATNRLAKAMAGVDDESKGAGAALGALGLDVEKFKQLKADDQLVELAKAMGKFEDGSGKSAAAMALLGKNGADLLPFLKDLAGAQELVATVTSEQASQADQLADAMAVASGKVEGLKREFALGLLPQLVQAMDLITAVATVTGGYLSEGAMRGNEAVGGMTTAVHVFGKSIEYGTALVAAYGFALNKLAKDAAASAAAFDAFQNWDFKQMRTILSLREADAAKERGALDDYLRTLLNTTERQAEAARIVAKFGISAKEAAAEVARLDARLGQATRGQVAFSAAQAAAARAAEAAAKAADTAAKAHASSLRKQYLDQIASSQANVMAMEVAAEGTEALTQSEKSLMEMQAKIQAGTLEYNASLYRQAAAQFAVEAATEKRLRVDKQIAQALIDAAKHQTKLSDEEAAKTDQVRQQLVAEQERLEKLYMTEAALRANETSTIRATAADLQFMAAMRGGDAELEKRAHLLRQLADTRDATGVAQAMKEAKEASAVAAAASAEDWQRMADQTGQALADALMQGGRSAGEYLKGLFRSMVLRPIIQAVVSPVSGAIASFLTGGAAGGGSGGAGAGAAAGLNNLSTLQSLYSAATGYSSGVNSLAGFLGAGTTAGASSASLAYANMVGAAGGDSLGALIAANNSWGGVAAGNSLGAAAAGEGVAAGSGAAGASGGASSTMGAWGAYAGYAAMIYAAAQYASKLYGQGFTGSKQLEGNSWYDYSDKAVNLKVFEALGMSEKWSQILSGSVRWNHMFGRAEPRVQGRGVQGTFSGGAFSGQAYADVLEKGGLFRSDKRYTVSDTLDSTIDTFFDDAAKSVHDQAKRYGEALGLPATLMASVTKEVKVQLTGDMEKDKAEIMKALGGYGDALIAGYAEKVKPLALYGETTAQTIARVGNAIVQVNSVLDTLGMTALAASVDGGKAAVQLADMFGGLDKFGSAAGNFLGKYFSEAERAALQTKLVSDAFAQYGAVMPTTRAAFRDLVEAQDLSTEAGRRNFAALMSVADAFDAVAARGEAIGEKRGDLEIQLLRAQGNELGAVALERQRELEALRKLDPALVALQQSINAATDAAQRAAMVRQLQDAIDSELPKFLTPSQQSAHRYGMIARDLQQLAGLTIDVATLQAATKDDILAFAASFVNLSDGASDAEIAVVRAAGGLADLKNEAMAAASEFGGMRLRSQGQASAADQAYRDWMGMESKISWFADAWTNNTLPANLQNYVDGHWGGKENVPGPTQDAIFNQFLMQTNGPQNQGPDRETSRVGGDDGGWAQRAEEERRRQEEIQREQRDRQREQLEQLMELVNALDRIEQAMTDWRNQWQLGELSNLDPAQQYELASDNLSALYADAMAGNWEAFDQWQAAADDFLQESNSYFGGGTGAAADKEAVYGMWEELMALRESMEGLMQQNIDAVKSGAAATSGAVRTSNELAREAATQSKLNASSRLGFR